MKQIILAVVLSLVSVGAFATPPNLTPHVLSGSIIYVAIPGSPAAVVQENVEVDFLSESACAGAKTAKEHSAFSPLASVTNGAKSEGDIRKFVNLQCLPKF